MEILRAGPKILYANIVFFLFLSKQNGGPREFCDRKKRFESEYIRKYGMRNMRMQKNTKICEEETSYGRKEHGEIHPVRLCGRSKSGV